MLSFVIVHMPCKLVTAGLPTSGEILLELLFGNIKPPSSSNSERKRGVLIATTLRCPFLQTLLRNS